MNLPNQNRLGDFEIIRELGRGGMGIVYEALQISLNRKVALKVLGTGLGLTRKSIDRFHREAEAAAKLHHTNIVPVYATGEENGAHFYAMELIDGPSLDRVIKSWAEPTQPKLKADESTAVASQAPAFDATASYAPGSPPLPSGLSTSSITSGTAHYDSIARMIADVADALDHAHKNNVIHRDIKPSNLLLGPDGRLSINDFGLARMLEQPGMTMTGEFVGTPAYMSPEQITAGRIPIDHRTDIYSLGATLYELLTQRPPFIAERRDQMLAQIVQKEPQAPRRINKSIPIDLETICLKALEKDPDRRYQSGGAFAEDLRRYINRFAIAARRAGVVGKAKKWIKRNPALTVAAFVILLALSGVGVLAWQAHEAEQRRVADEKRRNDELRNERQQNALERAMLAGMRGDFDEAERQIGDAELNGAPPGRIRLLRGQFADLRGDAADAVRHLEEAVKLMPDSVAARCMLAEAAFRLGRSEFALKLLPELQTLEPKTPEDFLYLGRIASRDDPVRGLQLMSEAIRQRDSPLARMIRSEAQSYRASDTADPEDARIAVEDATVALSMLRDNPNTIASAARAYLAEWIAWEANGDALKAADARKRMQQQVDALARFPDSPVASMFRCEVAMFTGAANAEELVKQRLDRFRTPYDASVYALLLSLRGDNQGAIACLEEFLNAQPDFATQLAYMHADSGRLDEAYRLYEAASKSDDLFTLIFAERIVRFLGRHDERRQIARRLSLPAMRWFGRRDWMLKIIRFEMDEVSARELLAAAGSSRLNLCEGHFYLGMAALSDGDRESARMHFRKAIETRVFDYNEYSSSQWMLSRLEKDPKWPPWIGMDGKPVEPKGDKK